MKRLECLDGLRGVLAVYVMLGHMAPFAAGPAWLIRPLGHGGAAVDIFFILSGLVIVRSLESYGYRGQPFLIARAARIFPVFLVTFGLAIAVQPLQAGFDRMAWVAPDGLARGIWSDGWPHTWAPEIVAHLTMTHGLFPNGTLPGVWISFLGSAWSLSTEWQFYLVALLTGRAGASPRRLALLLLGIAAAGLAWRIAAPEPWQFSRAFLANKGQYFALGVASAGLVARNPGCRLHFAIVLVATLALSWPLGGMDKLLPPLAWTACLAAQLRPDLPGLRGLAKSLQAAPVLWLGAVSYGLYLVNEPIQKLAGVALTWLVQGNAAFFTALWLPGATLLPLLAAAWLHRHVEAPALRWGRGFFIRDIRRDWNGL